MALSLGLRTGLSAGGVGTPAPGPINTVAPVISGTPAVGETLSSTTGTWTGTGTITYARQWFRGGDAISGATSTTYTVVEADQGFAITCRVTATDDEGSRSRSSNSLSIPAAPSGVTTFDSTAITFDSTALTFDEAA